VTASPGVQLSRTATGQKLHIPPCPHVLGVELIEVSKTDAEGYDVCTWCQAELDGVGRTYYDSLDDAMRAFQTYEETRATIKEALRAVTFDAIWIPNSRSYIALGDKGLGVAWVGKTYIVPGRGGFIELPGFSPGSGGGTARSERTGEICPGCFTEMPLAGGCGTCG
jgi:hypothetical protein